MRESIQIQLFLDTGRTTKFNDGFNNERNESTAGPTADKSKRQSQGPGGSNITKSMNKRSVSPFVRISTSTRRLIVPGRTTQPPKRTRST